MELYRSRKELEYLPESVIAVPASELLQNPLQVASLWPEICAENPEILDQVERHNEQINSLKTVLDNLPDPTMSLEAAVTDNHISSAQLTSLYQDLGDLLLDEDYARLVLYLPFEFLPNRSWISEDEELQFAKESFRYSYLTAWRSLLHVHDVRANFVDGDVLETELRPDDLPRAVKAAHLIPKLVEAGMIELDEAMNMLRATEDELLQQNIQESLLVLSDMGLVNVTALDRQTISGAADETQPEAAYTTERRQAWLDQKQTDKIVASKAARISNLITGTTYMGANPSDVLDVFMSGYRSLNDQAIVEGILKAVESSALTGNYQVARAIYANYEDYLLSCWGKDDVKLKVRLDKSFRHFCRLNIVDRQQLDKLGINLPNLASPLSKNLELMPEVIDRLKHTVELIEADENLKKLIYPVISLGGSRLKGYGEQSSDIDLAVFVKPGTPETSKDGLRDLLKSVLGEEAEPIEFWLEDNQGQLKSRDSGDADAHMADAYWTHTLFGSAWIGNPNAIEELQKRLLQNYFYDTDELVHGVSARNIFLQRLEQDLLQYRLMHKGYERHYPRLTSIDSEHSDLIDGNSIFWDSGYRRVATQLFINNVFLPKL